MTDPMTPTTLTDAIAEIERLKLEREEMHRRAQKAEGLLERTRFILEGILLSRDETLQNYHILKHVKAAFESARAGSGRGFSVQYDFMRKERAECEARLTALEAAQIRAVEMALKMAADVALHHGELWRKKMGQLCVAHGRDSREYADAGLIVTRADLIRAGILNITPAAVLSRLAAETTCTSP